MLRRLTFLALGLTFTVAAIAAPPPPLSLFGQLPTISSIQLSPDGKRWVAAMGDEQSAQIQVRAVADNKLLSITQVEKSKLRDVMWVGNDHIVSTVSTTTTVAGLEGPKREWFLLSMLDLSKDSKWRPLLDAIPDTMNAAAGTPRPFMRNGQPAIVVPVWHFPSNVGLLALAEVRLGRSHGLITTKGNSDTRSFFIGSDGEAIARADYKERGGEWQLFLKTGGSFHKVYAETALIDYPGITSFGRDESTLVLTSHKSGEWEDYEINRADGSVSGPTTDYKGDSVLLDRRRRTVIGTIDTDLERTEYRFFDPKDAGLWRGIAKAFPGEQVSLESWSDDRQVIIVEVQGEQNGVSLFKIDRTNGKAEFMADRYDGLGPELLSPVTTFTYKAADGLDIPAYLTLPRGRAAKGLPLIVLAHGGPASRDMPGFDWWAQALASRGYAVLQPQFRGSTGFGHDHEAAGYGQWGRKMQTDLSDGVRALTAKGTIDPKRVCIAGASYGGYAAMAGVTLDPGVYRCASAVAGVSDLRRMLLSEISDAGGERNATLRYWQRFMGARNASDETIDAWSPARLADKVSVPLQLIHGKDDTVVRIEQSRLMVNAMKKAGKPVDYLELAGEDHWLSKPATRIALLEAQVAFLLKHNPPN
ncbi:alpha/beta hydrolase family protein [Sandarakinorhabdus oryzae]|uniref:alpha/beta hydrolase family protein n=1 Tax=Sandarakinorhabdus oryzae TaxID=2675220 RepID=UPI0012E25E8A|nr:S9 family peptidase [Sandarakinorhabdus oryzae]